jgi:hypothetical protein
MFLPSRSRSIPFPSSSVSYIAAVAAPDAWLAMSTQGTIQSPTPGNSSALERYIASTSIQSSKLSRPSSSSHQYFLHQLIFSVAVRKVSNSRSKLFSLARTAGRRVVPVRISVSSSVQKVGSSSSGRNFMYLPCCQNQKGSIFGLENYSVKGFKTPMSLKSGHAIVACIIRKTSTAPRGD